MVFGSSTGGSFCCQEIFRFNAGLLIDAHDDGVRVVLAATHHQPRILGSACYTPTPAQYLNLLGGEGLVFPTSLLDPEAIHCTQICLCSVVGRFYGILVNNLRNQTQDVAARMPLLAHTMSAGGSTERSCSHGILRSCYLNRLWGFLTMKALRHTYRDTHSCIYIYACIYIYVYIYTYVHVYRYMQRATQNHNSAPADVFDLG